ncbi:unnamed protein product [marine sediment metagenome]|uniref:Uncharacterized protein n=1 Tax=marine sediment metagenome TaxID=412755 RepID=X0XPD3_9ZZZZ
MKLTRYITKYDYELFSNHYISLNQLLDRSNYDKEKYIQGMSFDIANLNYKISIEIKENK